MLNRTQYLAGKVRRWHTVHGLHQTTADHSWGVAVILTKIVPGGPSAALLEAALYHDTGEIYVGDIPAYAKNQEPVLADLLADAEGAARHTLGFDLPDLTSEEEHWLELADVLEAHAFVSWCGEKSTDPELVVRQWQRVVDRAKPLSVDANYLWRVITNAI